MKYRHLHGYKYELLETESFDTKIIGYEIATEHIALWESGRLFVFAHYAWDGASGPTFDTKTSMRGSLAHDALYQLIREKLIERKYRKYADELLRDICIADGMWKWRANLWCWAVKKFAKQSSFPEEKPRGRTVEI